MAMPSRQSSIPSNSMPRPPAYPASFRMPRQAATGHIAVADDGPPQIPAAPAAEEPAARVGCRPLLDDEVLGVDIPHKGGQPPQGGRGLHVPAQEVAHIEQQPKIRMPHPGHQTFHAVNVLKEETVVFHHGGDAFGFGALGYGATGGGQAVGHLLEAGGGRAGPGMPPVTSWRMLVAPSRSASSSSFAIRSTSSCTSFARKSAPMV